MMKNLAGDYGCDPQIAVELKQAGITLVLHEEPLRQEVPASVTGQLTLNGKQKFTFARAWYYWMVSGTVPMDVALELYANPIGAEDVRVVGHCGCPPPNEKRESGEYIWADGDGKKRPYYIGSYHIDSQEGLNLFVATLKKHGLVD